MIFDKFDSILVGNFLPSRHICKFLTQIDIFWKFLPKPRLGENFDPNRFNRRYWLKSRFTEIVEQDQDFPPIMTKIEIFTNFDQNRDICKCRHCSKNLTIINIWMKFCPKSPFWKVLTKIESFRQFWQKSRFFEIFIILTKIEIFFKISTKVKVFLIILTRINICWYFDQNWLFF